MIDGNTILIAHLGYPTATFKSPMIYNPYFESIGANAVVVPMGVRAEHYADFLQPLFRLTNIRGDDAAQGDDARAGRRDFRGK
jgi:shikimate dehydrogenase